MSAVPAFIRLVPWQALRVPATGVPTSPVVPVEEIIRETDVKRLDQDPADPNPKRKNEPQTDPQADPKRPPPPFEQDPTTCQLRPPNKETLKKLKTQVVIASNCEQAMRDAYNRGYKTGRAVSKRFRSPQTFRCQQIKADGEFLGRRLKRIILQQENGPRRRVKVSSRNGGGVIQDILDAAS